MVKMVNFILCVVYHNVKGRACEHDMLIDACRLGASDSAPLPMPVIGNVQKEVAS